MTTAVEEEVEFSADAPEESFKAWVKEMRAVDAELKEAGKALTAIRKRRRALSDAVLAWMQGNSYEKVQVHVDEQGVVSYLQRFEKEVLEPVNAEYLYETLLRLNSGDETLASATVNAIYNNREASTKELLKVVKVGGDKKRGAKMRPVGGASM